MGCSQSKNNGLVAVEKAPIASPRSKTKTELTGLEHKYEHEHTDRSSTSSAATSRQENMIKWKKDLAKSGNMAKAIVNIETSLTKRVEDVYDGIFTGPSLGEGAAGVVRKCVHRETGVEFAVKCLNIGLITDEATIETMREEIFIMCQADHPDIIRLEEVYESENQIFLIINLLTGGDMFDRLEQQPNYHYSEVQCARIVKQMISSVRYLHANKVVHRDLKLENFLFDDAESNNIRLIDFGLSKHFDLDEGCKLSDAVGTPYTAAPEVIRGEYDEKVDVWAIGVITYLLLCGDPPFGGMDGEALLEVRQNILDCNLVFEPSEIWGPISNSAKNFIRRLLTKDPEQRPSAGEAAQDEWLTTFADKDSDYHKPLNSKLVKNLMEFKEYSNLQKILLEVVSFTLVPDQIKELKQEFEKIDTDGTGDITLDELKEVMLNRVETDSMGSLTEDEVETLFDSLRLDTKSASIKWHNFITAGLSRCDYDDRNLRLAFNRLDADGKGYVTLSDLKELVGSKEGDMDEEVCAMWKDGMKSVESKEQDRISFKDFKHFFTKHDRSKKEIMQSLRNIGSLQRYSHSSHNFRATGALNKRMNSARVLAATFGIDVGAAGDTDPAATGGTSPPSSTAAAAAAGFPVRGRRAPNRRSMSCGALLVKSRMYLNSLPVMKEESSEAS